MALPPFLAPSLTPQELTFLAENEEIEIVPMFSMGKIRLISGVYGPFQPPSKTRVPLWFALSLKRKKKCRIIPPDWMTVENLGAIITVEKERRRGRGEAGGGFVPLPRFFVEVGKVLLDVASSDLQSPSTLHSLLLSLRHIRLSKTRALIHSASSSASPTNFTEENTNAFEGAGEHVELTGLTPIEVGEVKGFLGGVMGMLGRLDEKGLGEGEE